MLSLSTALVHNTKAQAQTYAFGLSQNPSPVPQLVLNGNIMLNASEVGWWMRDNAQYLHNNGGNQDNYAAGFEPGKEIRNYFQFLLPAFVEFKSAVLRVNAYSIFGSPLYTMYDYVGDAGVLASPFDPVGTTVFDDLGSGTAFGQRAFSESESNQMVDIEFNAAGIAALNNRTDARFSIGGAVQDASAATVVPEPGTIALLGVGLMVLLVGARAKRSSSIRTH